MSISDHSSPTLLICGYGPGISHAVAERWATAGYRLALVARNRARLDAAVAAFGARGIAARGWDANLADPEAVMHTIHAIRAEWGPIGTLHWNAFAYAAGDLLEATTAEMQGLLDISLHGFLASIRAALPDVEQQRGSILATGGGFAFFDDKVDDFVATIGAMGGAIAKAALHKAVGVLHHKLAPRGVYVGEVVINDVVKGTPFDKGAATLTTESIAALFWKLHSTRETVFITT